MDFVAFFTQLLLTAGKYLKDQGHDPNALLTAHLDAVDAASYAALDAKFPDEP